MREEAVAGLLHPRLVIDEQWLLVRPKCISQLRRAGHWIQDMSCYFSCQKSALTPWLLLCEHHPDLVPRRAQALVMTPECHATPHLW